MIVLLVLFIGDTPKYSENLEIRHICETIHPHLIYLSWNNREVNAQSLFFSNIIIIMVEARSARLECFLIIDCLSGKDSVRSFKLYFFKAILLRGLLISFFSMILVFVFNVEPTFSSSGRCGGVGGAQPHLPLLHINTFKCEFLKMVCSSSWKANFTVTGLCLLLSQCPVWYLSLGASN